MHAANAAVAQPAHVVPLGVPPPSWKPKGAPVTCRDSRIDALVDTN
jgi:hypothetical protein